MNEINGQISDGFHTFDELYEHRHRLFIALALAVDKPCWKSKIHGDGTSFDGWFLACIEFDDPVSYHLPDRLWDDCFMFESLPIGKEWDGHTADDVLTRLKDFVKTTAPSPPPPIESSRTL